MAEAPDHGKLHEDGAVVAGEAGAAGAVAEPSMSGSSATAVSPPKSPSLKSGAVQQSKDDSDEEGEVKETPAGTPIGNRDLRLDIQAKRNARSKLSKDRVEGVAVRDLYLGGDEQAPGGSRNNGDRNMLNNKGDDEKFDSMERDGACTRERERSRELDRERDKEKHGMDGELSLIHI